MKNQFDSWGSFVESSSVDSALAHFLKNCVKVHIKIYYMDFPGCPVVKNPLSTAGFDPWLGK